MIAICSLIELMYSILFYLGLNGKNNFLYIAEHSERYGEDIQPALSAIVAVIVILGLVAVIVIAIIVLRKR